MDSARWHMQKVAWSRIDDVLTARPRLHSEAPVDDVDRCLVCAVVVPTGGRPRKRSSDSGPETLDLYRSLANHAGGRISLNAILRRDVTNAIIGSHRECN